MPNNLTPKQEAFALAIASGSSQSEAYRRAYNVSENIKPQTVNKRASELMANGDISGRVSELRQSAELSVSMTLEQHLNDLKRLRDAAVEDKKWGAAITAEVARGKAAGLVNEYPTTPSPILNICIMLN